MITRKIGIRHCVNVKIEDIPSIEALSVADTTLQFYHESAKALLDVSFHINTEHIYLSLEEFIYNVEFS